MKKRVDTGSAPRRRADVAGATAYVLIAGAVVLAWQVLLQPLMQRSPVEVAVRLAPGSPLVLRRAAEAELAAGRYENAAALSRDALGRSPFDVRALRVVGLTEARAGRTGQADDLLTLAGNWSLRDDPTHAWLIEHRLRRGDYASAFAHADTLARRRDELLPQIFRLFTIAATEDPQRALPVVAGLLADDPAWREAYLASLADTSEGLQAGANLAVMLQAGPKPLTNRELQRLYTALFDRGQITAVKAVRGLLNRPSAAAAVTNGGFDDPGAPEPLQWRLIQKAGAVASITADDLDPANPALRVEYDGYTDAVFAQQRTLLAPGRYRLSVDARTEAGSPAGRMRWTVYCAIGAEPVASIPVESAPSTADRAWTASAGEFRVTDSCPGQWLELRGYPLDRRTPMVVWFDRATIVSVDPAAD